VFAVDGEAEKIGGDSHARRHTMQAGDLGEHCVLAATETTRPGGSVATGVLNASETVLPVKHTCTNFL